MKPIFHTYSGQSIHLGKIRPEDVNIVDIARSLSMTCRFGGHCSQFYSVAQHSVMCSLLVHPMLAGIALLHDAAEAYIGDVITPLKRNIRLIRRWERQAEHAISKRFFWYKEASVFSYPSIFNDFHKEIKDADKIALFVEASSVSKSKVDFLNIDLSAVKHCRDNTNVIPLLPVHAEKEFMDRFEELSKEGMIDGH